MFQRWVRAGRPLPRTSSMRGPLTRSRRQSCSDPCPRLTARRARPASSRLTALLGSLGALGNETQKRVTGIGHGGVANAPARPFTPQPFPGQLAKCGCRLAAASRLPCRRAPPARLRRPSADRACSISSAPRHPGPRPPETWPRWERVTHQTRSFSRPTARRPGPRRRPRPDTAGPLSRPPASTCIITRAARKNRRPSPLPPT